VSGGPFEGRGGRALAAVAALSLAASALLAIFGDAFDDLPSFGADSYSRSALGHHAFVRLLRELGFEVLTSRHRTSTKLGPDTVLVVAEPGLGLLETRAEGLEEMRDGSTRMLLVLSKREGLPSATHPRWLGRTALVPELEAARALEVLGIEARVVRPPRNVSDWKGELPAPSVEGPQLVASEELVPLVGTAEGMLVGELREEGWHLVVLADPDVIATHGLGRGANAELAVRILERLADGGGGTVVVDETLHGWEASPSLARELLRWPLALATIQAALALALLAWAASVRFGRPRRDPPALAPGKAFLIENTAALLRHGGHLGAAVAAYWRAAKEQIVHALRAPNDRGAAPDALLARTAAARGKTDRLDALERRVAALAARRGAPDEAVRIALDIHRFREEMTNGSRHHP
jgi:hypothetical protein